VRPRYRAEFERAISNSSNAKSYKLIIKSVLHCIRELKLKIKISAKKIRLKTCALNASTSRAMILTSKLTKGSSILTTVYNSFRRELNKTYWV